MKKYISVRVVKANSYIEAVKKVQDNKFDETDEMCDKIYLLDNSLKITFLKKERGEIK